MVTTTLDLPITVVPAFEVLMETSRRLIDEDLGLFNIAVIVVHMACEVVTERKFAQAFTTKNLQYLQGSVTDCLNGYSLANDRNRNLYVVMTGDEVHKAAFWSKFKESADRRNQIMHKGLSVDKAAAEESYHAAEKFIAPLLQSSSQ